LPITPEKVLAALKGQGNHEDTKTQS